LVETIGMNNQSVAQLGLEFVKNFGGLEIDLEFESPEEILDEYKPYFMRVSKILGPKESRIVTPA
jgi:hypothetical protein